MSDEDDGTGAGRIDPGRRKALLDDLEAIRTLLDEEQGNADAIPVLREVVRAPQTTRRSVDAGAPDMPERAVPEPGAASGEAGAEGAESREEVQGDLFDPRAFADRLLDGEWAEERERILADARAGVTAFSLGLDEQERAEREARLRAAVEARLAPRMEQLLGEALDELQANMVRVVRRELAALVADCFGEQRPDDGSP